MQHYYHCWLNVTKNTTILKWIRNGYKIPFTHRVFQIVPPQNSLSTQDKQHMSSAVLNLIKLGAISKCSPRKDQFISTIFLAPKSNGGHRFILNLKNLNKFVSHYHFKMEDHRTASKMITEGSYMATIDLKESYLLVPVAAEHRQYLRFQFCDDSLQETMYEFNAMPYGLSSAPRAFTKIMKEVMTFLRNKGFKSIVYLDDILCLGDDYSECLDNVNETIKLLRCLGFVINLDKSSLHPTQCCKFLGFMYNSLEMTISLPTEKRDNIRRLVQKYSRLPLCTIRDLAHLNGVLTSACPAVRYGWLYTKRLERQKYLALRKYQDYEAKFKPASSIIPDLEWWAKNILNTSNSLTIPEYDLEIFTDASKTGWGACCGSDRVNGWWKENEKHFHINYLELLAIFLALKSFAEKKRSINILLRVDNTTAISYVNRMGGVQFPHLTELSRSIWQWCEEREIWLFASYINSKENVVADFESRKINPDIELQLSDLEYKSITASFGEPTIDLFASRINAKCDKYVSWGRDPDAFSIDAFTLFWGNEFFYAFPPFSLILKCIQKIISDRASGILVIPYWPSQPWFPLLNKIRQSEFLIFESFSSSSRIHHQTPRRFTLAAAVLSGQRSSQKEHQAPL